MYPCCSKNRACTDVEPTARKVISYKLQAKDPGSFWALDYVDVLTLALLPRDHRLTDTSVRIQASCFPSLPVFAQGQSYTPQWIIGNTGNIWDNLLPYTCTVSNFIDLEWWIKQGIKGINVDPFQNTNKPA